MEGVVFVGDETACHGSANLLVCAADMDNKLNFLRDKIRSYESVVVAFSGGVDSAVLVAVAHDVIPDKTIAVTGNSPSVPSRDLSSAKAFCQARGISHYIIDTDEMNNGKYALNPENRCFYCKSELFNKLTDYAKKNGFKFVLEGTNASEMMGHRPGHEAACNNEMVRTPYVDLGITKDDIRAIARELKLEVAERPATACLSSRFPTGSRIDADTLKNIDAAENFILGLGIRQVRLRHHGDIARIEIDPDDFQLLSGKRDFVVKTIQALGWRHVTIDLGGYRTGEGR